MGQQMLLVLLALILFSTILVNTYDNVFAQREYVYKGLQLLQGQKLADSLNQIIECELFKAYNDSDTTTTFSSVIASNTGSNFVKVLDDVSYNFTSSSAWCDSLGNIGNPTTAYQRVDIRIQCIYGGQDTLYIGTSTHPVSKVFANPGLDL